MGSPHDLVRGAGRRPRTLRQVARRGLPAAPRETGIGIAAEHFPHIFDRFYRVDSARPRHSSATGLGLAICQSIAVAHQGDLEIESQPGRGTRMTVVLPATLVEAERRPAVAGPSPIL